MNKADLVEAFKMETELTTQEAASIVNLFFDEMSNALSNGDRVEIRGLCSLHLKKYHAYTGRNPKTGAPAQIKSKKLPFFKCGKELKGRVNGQINP